jgi:hypothetical protein
MEGGERAGGRVGSRCGRRGTESLMEDHGSPWGGRSWRRKRKITEEIRRNKSGAKKKQVGGQASHG